MVRSPGGCAPMAGTSSGSRARRPPTPTSTGRGACSRELPLADVDVLVHAAYDFTPTAWEDIKAINIDGTRRLFDAAVDAGVERIIYISSPAAFQGHPVPIRHREAADRVRGRLARRRDRPPRPGLRAALRRDVRAPLTFSSRLPIVPLIVDDSHPILMAHEEDVGDLVAAIADGREEPPPGRPLLAACADPFTLRSLISAIARARGSARRCLSRSRGARCSAS